MRATFETKLGKKTFERDASTIRGYMQIIDGKLIHLKVFPVPDPCDECRFHGIHPCDQCAYAREMAAKAEVA
jgi:hypothetical protein